MQIPRRNNPHSILSAALFAALAIAPAALIAAAQQPPKTFSGQLDIREREILVSLPAFLAKARLQPGVGRGPDLRHELGGEGVHAQGDRAVRLGDEIDSAKAQCVTRGETAPGTNREARLCLWSDVEGRAFCAGCGRPDRGRGVWEDTQ